MALRKGIATDKYNTNPLRFVLRTVLLMIALGFYCASVVQAATIEQQRVWFMQARQALDAQQMDTFASLKAKLADYPLTPYLDIWQAWKQLGQGNDAKVAATLEKFADIPESNDLRMAWIESLAERNQWPQVATQLGLYPRLRKKLPDIAMMADWQEGNKKAALQHFSETWLHEIKLADISEPLHKAWLGQGHPTDAERWSRMILLAENGRWGKVGILSAGMGKQQKQWLHDWRELQAEPETGFSHWPASLSHPLPAYLKLSKAMISDGLTRLAKKDPLQAHASLQKLKRQTGSDIKEPFYDALEQQISLRAAKRHLPVAAQWLEQLPATEQNVETRGWQARLHMLQHDWQNVLQVINAMPPAEQQRNRWQYWKAYALEMNGDIQQATPIFTRLADKRSYYGFLSAEHIGQPYRFDNESLDASPVLIRKLNQLPGLRRAHEWLTLENNNKAEREWNVSLAGSDSRTWKAAAAIAVAWNWPDQAIRAAARAGATNMLEERFPLPYEHDVMQMAKATGLSPSSIWGVIRQESIFNKQAHSPAGGRGLMQLLPRTANMMARRIGLHKGYQDLFSPTVNIRLGSHYLADLKSRFNDNLVLAAAAYNAGPDKVSQWLERTPFNSAEIWVEAIPFNETRRYVQHVMAYTVVYQWRKQQQPASLAELMNTQPRTVSLNEENN
jgi:peptidoglycan lytic transglycosylase